MSFYTQFAAYYESIFPFSETVFSFLETHLPTPPVRVLDVGCGTGHYTGRLAEAGYAAVGVDLDAAMIAYAQSHYPGATFRAMNMTDIGSLPGPFDAVVCIGNTAAHLTQDQLADFIAAVGATLASGRPWILQVMNWDFVLRQESVTFPVLKGEEDGPTFYRAYRGISESQVTFATRLEVDGAVVFEDAVPLYPLRSTEIIALHAAHGFTLREHLGSYGGAPFNPETFSADIYVWQKA